MEIKFGQQARGKPRIYGALKVPKSNPAAPQVYRYEWQTEPNSDSKKDAQFLSMS